MSEALHVMAAVIRGSDGRILIARRGSHQDQGGLWEFPGGKLEPGEARLDGLRRELREELGIDVQAARPLIGVLHHYPKRSVWLDVWLVSSFSGEAHGAEGQPLRWVEPAALDAYAFPEANRPIVTAAQLPERYLITPELDDLGRLCDGLEQALTGGIRLVQLRQNQLDAPAYADWAEQLLARFDGRIDWLFKGSRAPHWPGAGWHLRASQLAKVSREELARCGGWTAASCHNANELQQALALGVDFVTLSPLLPTASHPQATPLGWEQAAALLRDFAKPAYLLGGLSAPQLPEAWQHGAQGIAGIRGLWR